VLHASCNWQLGRVLGSCWTHLGEAWEREACGSLVQLHASKLLTFLRKCQQIPHLRGTAQAVADACSSCSSRAAWRRMQRCRVPCMQCVRCGNALPMLKSKGQRQPPPLYPQPTVGSNQPRSVAGQHTCSL
jgi:hypothetical protein